jgi:pimeloyl-ACP methyl ester carboxylesterase
MSQRSHPPHYPPPLAAFGGAVPDAPAWFQAAMADRPDRGTVTVQGAPIETLTWGRAGDPGLLLLHGNGAHADWFRFIAPQLKAGRRVVAMSFSGMGGSGWRTQYSVAQWADEALAVAEASGLFSAPVPPTVVAHSFGGFPLMNLAARFGDRLARAVIVDTPLRPPPGVDAKRRHRAENLRSARVYDSEAEALMRFRFLPPQGCAHPFVADVIARRGLKCVTGPQGQPGWVWRFDPLLFRHFDFGRPYRDLKQALCPVTLVRGGRSRLVTAELMAHAVALAPPGTEVLELADADHHVMVDQPQAFAQLLAGLVAAA